MKKINISPAIEGIIFDCDGTLADTMPLHWEAWHETLDFFSAECPQDFLEVLKGVPTKTIVEKINKSFGYVLDPNLFSEEKERRLLSKLHRVKSIQPVEDLAREYQDRVIVDEKWNALLAFEAELMKERGLTAKIHG